MIDNAIFGLVQYAISEGLAAEDDRIYCTNRLLSLMKLNEYAPDPIGQVPEQPLYKLLNALCDNAAARGIIENSPVYRDLFDTALTDCLLPRPSEVIREFRSLYKKSPEAATDYFYHFSQKSNYIRTDRVTKDQKWKVNSPYGEIDITINLSKPEKDPKAIAAAKLVKPSGYPRCSLCVENEGYAGRADAPARQNHRMIPLTVCGEDWRLQYSPYVYYNEHCILLNAKHTPMRISGHSFRRLLDFVRQFPHYFIGSNADLPIVGGSILSHDHFQGGRYTFAMAKAPVEIPLTFDGFESVNAGIVRWPLSTIRLTGDMQDEIIALAEKILAAWRGYSDPDSFIFAETAGEPHNTITPIARMADGHFQLDLVLRNNITTAEHPLGVYHPHASLHHIKKENIGLIEVMGLAVLPARLNTEMNALADRMLHGADLTADALTAKHAEWAYDILRRRKDFAVETADAVLKEEIGKVFVRVLEDAGVYKVTPEGRTAFMRFVQAV